MLVFKKIVFTVLSFYCFSSYSQKMFNGNDSLQVVFLIRNYEIELEPINSTQDTSIYWCMEFDEKFIYKLSKRIIKEEKGVKYLRTNPIGIIYLYKGYWVIATDVDSKKKKKASEFHIIINSCNLKVERIFFS